MIYSGLSSNLFRRTFDVNVFGLVDMTTVSLPHLRRSQGCIVNIGSRSAWRTEILVSSAEHIGFDQCRTHLWIFYRASVSKHPDLVCNIDLKIYAGPYSASKAAVHGQFPYSFFSSLILIFLQLYPKLLLLKLLSLM